MRTDGEQLFELAKKEKFREFTMSELMSIHDFSVPLFWNLKGRYQFIGQSIEHPALLKSFKELGKSLDHALCNKHLILLERMSFLNLRFEISDHDDDGEALISLVDSDEPAASHLTDFSNFFSGQSCRFFIGDLSSLLKHNYDDYTNINESMTTVACFHQEFTRSSLYLNVVQPKLRHADLQFTLGGQKNSETMKGVVKI